MLQQRFFLALLYMFSVKWINVMLIPTWCENKQSYTNSVKKIYIPDLVNFITLEEGEKVRSILTKYLQDPGHLVEGSQTITYQPYSTLIYVWANVFICNKTKYNLYHVQYMYMLSTVCPNQFAEAVCQRCSYEKVICKAHVKKL